MALKSFTQLYHPIIEVLNQVQTIKGTGKSINGLVKVCWLVVHYH